MDLDTTKRLSSRLRTELVSFNHPEVSIAPVFVTNEISRLDKCIESESKRSVGEASEVKIPVENESHILIIARECGLNQTDTTFQELVSFECQLCFEYRRIESCNPPVPHIFFFIHRVIERLDDEIIKYLKRVESRVVIR